MDYSLHAECMKSYWQGFPVPPCWLLIIQPDLTQVLTPHRPLRAQLDRQQVVTPAPLRVTGIDRFVGSGVFAGSGVIRR